MKPILIFIVSLWTAAVCALGLGNLDPALAAVDAFQPTQMPGLKLWLDANRITATNGATVGKWDDFSGESFNFLGYTGAVLNATMLAGRPAVVFGGLNSGLTNANPLVKSTNSGSVACVLVVRTVAASQYQTIIGQSAGPSRGFSLLPQAFPEAGPRFATDIFAPGGIRNTVTSVTNTPYVVIFSWTNWVSQKSGGFYIMINGVLQSVEGYGSALTTVDQGPTGIGCWPPGTALSHFRGAISEIIYTTNALSGRWATDCSRYLGGKYGIVVQ